MHELNENEKLLTEAKYKLEAIERERNALLKTIESLEVEKNQISEQFSAATFPNAAVTNNSSPEEKVRLFSSLFRGREDVFPKRFENYKTGKSGYQPVCRNEWVRGVCGKPKIKCVGCEHREFIPISDDVFRNHLLGGDPSGYQLRNQVGFLPNHLSSVHSPS